jgi:hypothetical protein
MAGKLNQMIDAVGLALGIAAGTIVLFALAAIASMVLR